jgi:hypothetical protein
MRQTTFTEPRVGHISAESDTGLSTRTAQMRVLVQELGVTRQQAHALIKAYELDVANCHRIGNDTRRTDADFLAWVMCQQPGGRKPKVTRDHRLRLTPA